MRSIMRLAAVGCAAAAVLLLSVPINAQVPDEFTNLKLLDKDIGKRELIGIMRSFATSLGVRCNHCHVGPDNLQGMDFATDEKEHKRAARAMVEMVMAINSQYMGSWEDHAHEGEGEHDGVTCFTCHRGQPEPPLKITSILGETATSDGVDAAMTQYSELKAEHYGAGVYDFREEIFSEIAQEAFAAGQPEVAIETLRASLELFPENADLHATLGMALMQSGDTEGATDSFDAALELDPENASAQRGKTMLERSQQ